MPQNYENYAAFKFLIETKNVRTYFDELPNATINGFWIVFCEAYCAPQTILVNK